MLYLAVSLIAGTLAAGLGFSYYLDMIPGFQVEEKNEPTLIIKAQTVQGTPLSMYVNVGDESGYTPFMFYGTGVQNARMSNFDAFKFTRWEDGTTSLSRAIELNDNMTQTITAIYLQQGEDGAS